MSESVKNRDCYLIGLLNNIYFLIISLLLYFPILANLISMGYSYGCPPYFLEAELNSANRAVVKRNLSWKTFQPPKITRRTLRVIL